MKNEEYFDRHFEINPESPTSIYYKGTTIPAGWKQKDRDGYQWVVTRHCQIPGGRKQFIWCLTKAIYEKTHGVTLRRNQMVIAIDGNRDNLHPDNLKVVPFSIHVKQKERNTAFYAFRNVVLKRSNPDYFKDPKDWTDPEALQAIEDEKRKRKNGESAARIGTGLKAKWI
ncbi:hypothetical protein OL383_004423 [Salmonella enterica]|nr:hypothetical protein [Salmonella enterica]